MMFYLIAFLIGLSAGKMLAFPVLVGITVVCVIIGIYMAKTLEELAGLITMIFISCAIIGNVTMWITFYITTNQSWLGTIFNTYIFR